MSDISKLDERTEQLLRRISEVIEMPEMMQGIAAYALERDIRTRIRELVEEARREGYESDKHFRTKDFSDHLPT